MPYLVLFLALLNFLFSACACEDLGDDSSFDELRFCKSPKSPEAVQAFLKREDLYKVKGIYFKSFQLEDTFFQQIAKLCPQLITLDFCKYPLLDLGFLKYFPNIKSLILSHSKATDFSPLSDLLKLERLMLFGCSSFGDDQIPFIEHLKDSIKELAIGYNPLTDDGIEQLHRVFADRLQRIIL